jgi:hypothetical protein
MRTNKKEIETQEVNIYDLYKDIQIGETLRILQKPITIREDGKMVVNIVFAEVMEMSSDSFLLGVSFKNSKGELLQSTCWFDKSAFFIERHQPEMARVDVQIKNSFEKFLSEFHIKWLKRNNNFSIVG